MVKMYWAALLMAGEGIGPRPYLNAGASVAVDRLDRGERDHVVDVTGDDPRRPGGAGEQRPLQVAADRLGLHLGAHQGAEVVERHARSDLQCRCCFHEPPPLPMAGFSPVYAPPVLRWWIL